MKYVPAATVIWALIILVLSGYPGSGLPPEPFFDFDKLVHVGIYAPLAGLLYLWCRKRTVAKVASMFFAVVTGILYGSFMELGQEYIFILRNGDWYDFTANSLGCVVGGIVGYVYDSRKNNR